MARGFAGPRATLWIEHCNRKGDAGMYEMQMEFIAPRRKSAVSGATPWADRESALTTYIENLRETVPGFYNDGQRLTLSGRKDFFAIPKGVTSEEARRLYKNKRSDYSKSLRDDTLWLINLLRKGYTLEKIAVLSDHPYAWVYRRWYQCQKRVLRAIPSLRKQLRNPRNRDVVRMVRRNGG